MNRRQREGREEEEKRKRRGREEEEKRDIKVGQRSVTQRQQERLGRPSAALNICHYHRLKDVYYLTWNSDTTSAARRFRPETRLSP